LREAGDRDMIREQAGGRYVRRYQARDIHMRRGSIGRFIHRRLRLVGSALFRNLEWSERFGRTVHVMRAMYRWVWVFSSRGRAWRSRWVGSTVSLTKRGRGGVGWKRGNLIK